MTASNHHGSPSRSPEAELLPHSIEAEQAVIGGLLTDSAAWARVEGIINDQDFYRDDHRFIFRHIVALLGNGKAADIVTVFDSIQKANEVEQTGGLEYLWEIVNVTPCADSIQQYMEIVREKSLLRFIIRICGAAASEAIKGGGRCAQTIMDDVESRIIQVFEARLRASRERLSLESALDQAMNRIRSLSDCNDEDELTGLSSGYIDLDKLTSGFQRGDFIVVAGRPGMKASELTLNIAEHVGVDLGLPVLIFSHDVPAQQLALRLLASRARVDLGKLHSGRLTGEDGNKLKSGLECLHSTSIYFDDVGTISRPEFRAQVRRAHRQYGGLGLVVIDDIQMIGSSLNTQNFRKPAKGVADLSRELKQLAKELAVPIIACSSLSGKVEKRTDRRPMLSDLREFCAIDQDADLVLLLYQDDVYARASVDPGVTEVHIGKHRSGPLGVVRLAFNREYCRFESAPRMKCA
ncbi:MAG: replicative DNA helicase [Sulfuritalea sp.]|nr:replicative DNA helicase [Sulfuritalea sp.]